MPENKEKTFESDRILSYFQIEWRGLLAVTISGLIYNLGLLAGPWFEGQDGDIYFTQNDCFDGTYDFYIIVCNRTDKPDKREGCRGK